MRRDCVQTGAALARPGFALGNGAAFATLTSMASAELSAILLAGGASRRMGADKASLLFSGLPLWERQIGVLRELAPREIFISGRPDGPYAGAGFEIVTDASPGTGPLAGLVAGLRRAETPWLAVLAVDLPLMTATAMAGLVERARASARGRLPLSRERFEPLAAVYPKEALAAAEQALARGRLAMQSLARELIDLQLADPDALPEEEPELFRNANTPAEWQAMQEEIVRRLQRGTQIEEF